MRTDCCLFFHSQIFLRCSAFVEQYFDYSPLARSTHIETIVSMASMWNSDLNYGVLYRESSIYLACMPPLYRHFSDVREGNFVPFQAGSIEMHFRIAWPNISVDPLYRDYPSFYCHPRLFILGI